MTEEYERYIQRHAAAAESALFELRNALMGTGIGKCDQQAGAVEQMRLLCVGLAHEYGKGR